MLEASTDRLTSESDPYPGYRAVPAALREAAGGIDALLGELGELTTAGRAGRGGGVAGLRSAMPAFGHDDLADAFGSFCARWEFGVRSLVDDGAATAEGLRESVRAYEHTERAVGSEFVRLLTGVGDPRMDAEGFARQTPEQHLAGTVPDNSSRAWSRAADSMAATWSGVGRDVVDTGTDRMERLLSGRNPLRSEIDALSEIVE